MHITYVNSEIQDETPLGRLMHDFRCKNPDDMHYPELAEKTRYLKEEQGGDQAMGDVIQKLMDEFRDEFRAEIMAEVQAKADAKASAKVIKAEDKAAKAEAKVTKAEAKAAKAEAKAAKAETKAAKAERTSLAKKMLANNESVEKVALYSSLSLREVRALAKKMSA